MDIYKAILELREEKRRLDRAIAALEQGSPAPTEKRRRSWNSEARRAAAARMRKYWEQRRDQNANYKVNPPSSERT